MEFLGIPLWTFVAMMACSLALGIVIRIWLDTRRARRAREEQEQQKERKKQLKHAQKKARKAAKKK